MNLSGRLLFPDRTVSSGEFAVAVKRCAFCDRYVQWLSTKFGTRLQFDATPIKPSEAAEGTAWIAGTWMIRGRRRTVLAPLGHYSRDKQNAVKHVVQLHDCPPYREVRQRSGLD